MEKDIKQMIDIAQLEAKIASVREERNILKKRQASLRVKEHRLKKLLLDINQLELEI